MTDKDPKETEGSGGGDGGGETPPPEKDQENRYDIRADVDQKLENIFGDFDEDEDAVDAPADDEAVVAVPEKDEAVVDVPDEEPALASTTPEIAGDTSSRAVDATDPPAPSPVKSSPTPEAPSQPRPKVSPPPAEPKPRKSLTSRILVWGAVLIIIAVTVRFFLSYSAEELAPVPAKPGLLFHKIAPVPASLANITPDDQSAPPPKTAAPAAKATGTPQAAPPPKVSTPAAKPTGTVKAYVPRVYPYAIHIASFKSPDAARKELAHYHRGFQAYLVHVDLRKKGVWYRLFAGHFPSAMAALEAIKKYDFKDALVSRTRYACLLGSYTAVAQADAATRRLAGKGFFPYTLVVDGTYHVLMGAHPTRSAAKALLMDLSAAGFSSNLIER